jgi:hypothetical protein
LPTGRGSHHQRIDLRDDGGSDDWRTRRLAEKHAERARNGILLDGQKHGVVALRYVGFQEVDIEWIVHFAEQPREGVTMQVIDFA